MQQGRQQSQVRDRLTMRSVPEMRRVSGARVQVEAALAVRPFAQTRSHAILRASCSRTAFAVETCAERVYGKVPF